MQVKSYATLPPGKAASMRRPVMMYPAASSSPDRLYSSALIIS